MSVVYKNICKYCGKEFVRAWKNEIRIFCSIRCRNHARKLIPELRLKKHYCLICNKLFYAQACHNRRYCSNACNNKSRAKPLEERLLKFVCKNCGKVGYDAKSSDKKCCSTACANTMRIFTDKDRERHSIILKERWKDGEFVKKVLSRKNLFYMTKPEKKMKKILDDLNILYEFQYFISVIKHKYPADFYIPELKMIVEVDGRYWHGDERLFSKLNKRQILQKQRDLIRTKELKEQGFQVLRFWDNEITENIVKEKLLNNTLNNTNSSVVVS